MEVLSEWAKLSRGTFTPANVTETWGESEVTVAFELAGADQSVTAKIGEDWFDVTITEQLNAMLSPDAPHFHLHEVGDQTIGVALVTNEEAAGGSCDIA